jgi:hypothetical protein
VAGRPKRRARLARENKARLARMNSVRDLLPSQIPADFGNPWQDEEADDYRAGNLAPRSSPAAGSGYHFSFITTEASGYDPDIHPAGRVKGFIPMGLVPGMARGLRPSEVDALGQNEGHLLGVRAAVQELFEDILSPRDRTAISVTLAGRKKKVPKTAAPAPRPAPRPAAPYTPVPERSIESYRGEVQRLQRQLLTSHDAVERQMSQMNLDTLLDLLRRKEQRRERERSARRKLEPGAGGDAEGLALAHDMAETSHFAPRGRSREQSWAEVRQGWNFREDRIRAQVRNPPDYWSDPDYQEELEAAKRDIGYAD